jgi:hypothetical protein
LVVGKLYEVERMSTWPKQDVHTRQTNL